VPQPMVLGKICVYMGKKTGFVGWVLAFAWRDEKNIT
jgi:hypothetical protein